MVFKPGEITNPTGPGAQEGAGKPANWLREACRKASARIDTVKILEEAAKDKSDKRTQLKAIEMLWDRGWGKSEQPIDIKNEILPYRLDELEPLVKRSKRGGGSESNGSTGTLEGK
jgi:hypothetical protein